MMAFKSRKSSYRLLMLSFSAASLDVFARFRTDSRLSDALPSMSSAILIVESSMRGIVEQVEKERATVSFDGAARKQAAENTKASRGHRPGGMRAAALH